MFIFHSTIIKLIHYYLIIVTNGTKCPPFIRNNKVQWNPLNRDTFFGTNSYLKIEITSDNRDNRLYGTKS